MPTRRLDMEGPHRGAATLPISFDGQRYMARPGEPWSIALLAHGVHILGRSSKYHRPRGMFCGVGSCGSCVARVQGLPNVRLCQAACAPGAAAASQNTLGTARFDALGVVDWVFAGGLDHHHLLTQAGPLNRLAVAMARLLAGLGRLPDAPLPATAAPPRVQHVQVAIVGGGPAGRAAAAVTRRQGLSTWVLEAGATPHADVRAWHRAVAFYDDQTLLVTTPQGLVWLRADVMVLAMGGYELPPPCPGNDLPGVMGRRAAELALLWHVLPGRRVVVATPADSDLSNQRQVRQLVSRLARAGVTLVQVIGLGDAVPAAPTTGHTLVQVQGCAPSLRVESDVGTVACDALIWCPRPVPAHELVRQMGVETPFEPRLGGFVPRADADGRTARDGLYVAGELAGLEAAQAAAHGHRVGEAVVGRMRLVPTAALA